MESRIQALIKPYTITAPKPIEPKAISFYCSLDNKKGYPHARQP
ncbi:MAG: hypothetical protein P8X79_14370 [Reinekea sp.]